MKNFKHLLTLICLTVLTLGCDDDLDLAPQDELSEATIFSTYNNVRTYAWSFYDFLEAFPRSTTWAATRDLDGDLMQNGGSSVSRAYIGQNINVPANSAGSIYGVSYANIRRVNIMLDRIANSEMTTEEIAHWRGVGLFFRAHEFFDLLNTYGGVTWLENELTDTDTDILNAPRDSRDLVANNILRDLQEAIGIIKEDGDGPNTVNPDVARALLARFALFEGTWRKYHGLGDQDKFLNVAVQTSAELIDKHPNLHPNYDRVFNSIDLGPIEGVLLYKHYVIDEVTHTASTNTRSTNNKYDITRKGIDKFLTKNGLPVRNPNNTQFQGDQDFYAEFRDRDDRLLIMSPPPYTVNGDGSQNWTSTGNPGDEEFFPILQAITGGFPYKELPDRNWSKRVTGEVPNFDMLVPTQTGNGYRFWKIWNDHNDAVSSRDLNDDPIFRMGEILLIHAEAKFEVGEFNQSVADMTINKLRQRGSVAPMTIAQITPDFDPTRDPEVSPILFEIRRERAVEMMGEGVRRDDLRRWKKMDYATEVKLGRWIAQADYAQNIPIQGNAPEGYVQLIPLVPPAFPDHYYLFPLPADQLVLNPNIEQNPGW
ncbi:RagB/SusD family nutrient uptake outer membrane protein [Flagellimonas sp. S3867]|uniref:RagB/SusD family nutrient uptake outer membrane protein n=1 Tax=Flagellimonas sp. S3867 TaxID=2768063 RepID=UPI001689A9C0|nr:RagB/SusD family nutrient uptake outer membrane protein [Flagellimonas sp. S3867]